VKVTGNWKIGNGSRVAVVGGGPAGCFFALYLLKYARQAGVLPEITVYQERSFDEPGPGGCKGCAGVLSLSIARNLPELGLKIPPEVIQSRIDSYAVHSPYLSLSINNPDKEIEIISVYRGAGPLRGVAAKGISFDMWLMREAEQRGAVIAPFRVEGIDVTGRPAVKAAGSNHEYDLVVLAGGVNGRGLQVSGLEYRPPRTVPVAVAELLGDEQEVHRSLGNAAHAFLIPRSRVLFGSLVPKGQFINVSVMSQPASSVSVNDFLSEKTVQAVLPGSYRRVCACRPQVPVSSARGYFGDGFVAIGDAAVSRLYKDGIGSALVTARQAAHTVVHHGFAARDFRRYYQPLCRKLGRDNAWGKGLFFAVDRTRNSRLFLFAQHRLIGDEQNDVKKPQPFTRIAWGMFTGAYSYGSMLMAALRPGSLVRFWSALIREAVTMITPLKAESPRRLHIGGKKIVILGSGFGGTYALRYLVRALNKNENVDTVMISRENYFLFSPLVHEVALGGIEPRHIAYPIRRIHQRDRFSLVQSEVTGIDLQTRVVATATGNYPYDYLVLALGGVADRSELKSPGAQVFTLRTLRDSRLLRDHIIGVLERASQEKNPGRRKHQLTFVVSGGGYIGVQVVTELHDFVTKNIRKYYPTIPAEDVRIMLIEPEAKILPQVDDRLSRFAAKRIARMGIETRVNSRVVSCGEGYAELNGPEIVPAETIIWVAGQVAHPLVAELPTANDRLGRVAVTPTMEIPGYAGAYAVGDCAHFEDPLTGLAIPPRAHTAVRQAKTAALNILADLRGREKKPYHYSEGGEFVTLGDSSAMLRIGKLRLYGFPARVLWLLTYTLLVSGTYNRLRVMTDWLLAIIFGRHLTYFGYQREQ